MTNNVVLIIFIAAFCLFVLAVFVSARQEQNHYARFRDEVKTLNSEMESLKKRATANETKMQSMSDCLDAFIIKLDAQNILIQNQCSEIRSMKNETDILRSKNFGIEKKLLTQKKEVTINFASPVPITIVAPPAQKRKSQAPESLLEKAGVTKRRTSGH